MKKWLCISGAVAACALLAVEVGGQDRGGGRLSPASLDLDTCGCPTTFGEPYCEARTYWSLDKTADQDYLLNPDGTEYSFTVTVTEGETRNFIVGGGQIVVSNSGDQTTSLANVVVSLEKNSRGDCDTGGPSGRNWQRIRVALENESQACNDAGIAETCDYGTFYASAGSNLILTDPVTNDVISLTPNPEEDWNGVLVPPTIDNDSDGLRDEDPVYTGLNDTAISCDFIDNDGDGRYDEDPIDGIDNDNDGLIDEDDPDDDGDGQTDEDGACEDAVVINFAYEFDVTDAVDACGNPVEILPGDLMRINLVVTFVGGGGTRGGVCEIDVNCNGDIDVNDGSCDPAEGFCYDERYVRSVQQRGQFLFPGECTPVCDCVHLTDDGASAIPDSCVELTTNTLDEEICSLGEGTVTEFEIGGTVSCLGENCDATISNTAELTCDADPDNVLELIEGSPATASFEVECRYGACCFDDGSCEVTTEADCEDRGGTYQGDGTLCDPNPCPQPGACCLPDTSCVFVLFDACTAQGGVFQGEGTACADVDCGGGGGGPGACCLDDDTCLILVSAAACAAAGGEYQGQGTDCTGNPCDFPTGACCLPGGTTCVVTTQEDCEDQGGEYQGDGTDCDPNPCDEFPDPGDFCSQTQGGWGTDTCNGNNTACLRDTYFDEVFPGGLTVGTGMSSIHLTSSAAVAELLPTGGTSDCLHDEEGGPVGELTDPESTSAGVFAGQLIAATLNVAFDAAGYGKCTLTGDCDFCCERGALGTLVYTCGPLAGYSVNEVIALANTAIGDCDESGGFTYSQLSDALALLNEQFVDCDGVATDCLVFPE